MVHRDRGLRGEGGHFLALENPELYVQDVRKFFAKVREDARVHRAPYGRRPSGTYGPKMLSESNS